MSSAYRGESAERAPSEAGDSNAERSGRVGGNVQSMTGAVEREDVAGQVLKGRARNKVDPRRYRYDAVRGRGAALPFTVTRDAIMSAVDAGEMLHSIHVMCGVDRETENVLFGFDSGLWFCHTINGGSALVPGRSKFAVTGVTRDFDYGEIRDKLGVDMRRFFRAFADDITDVNRRVLRDYDPANPESEEKWGWLQEVAHYRGLSRFPHLAHDSADACLRLAPAERQALHTSKTFTIGNTPNAADRLKPTQNINSADRYDSTVGENY